MGDDTVPTPHTVDNDPEVAAIVADFNARKARRDAAIAAGQFDLDPISLMPSEARHDDARAPRPHDPDDPLLGDLPDIEAVAKPVRRPMRWRELEGQQIPDRVWFTNGWLHPGVTLLAGKGGIGKSLIGQQLAAAMALGTPFFSRIDKPVRSLTWSCEDEHDELWRRQLAIASYHAVPLGEFDDKGMIVERRIGLDNALCYAAYGALTWTPLIDELREQINDLKVDVLFLDNISQTFGGNENDRHHVTAFVNGLVGLCLDRPFAVVLYGHLAKAPNSEYSGSTAWENAVRMRWYLGKSLPDQPENDESGELEASGVRYLCKRKSNYSDADYVRFEWQEGLYHCKSIIERTAPERYADRKADAEAVVMQAIRLCQERNMQIGATPQARTNIYQVAKTLGLGSGFKKQELFDAVVRLRVQGTIAEGPVGSYDNRTKRFGLMFPNAQHTSPTHAQ